MSRTLITSARPVTLRVRPNRFLAAGLAAVIAAAGATLAFSGDDPPAPAQNRAAPSAPMVFGDPAVVKGASGGAAAGVPPQDSTSAPLFGDPTVRKGAGGR